MKKYIIVAEFDLKELMLNVNYYIDKGYIPIGGIAVGQMKRESMTRGGHKIAQAMVLGSLPGNVFNINVEQKEDHNENES